MIEKNKEYIVNIEDMTYEGMGVAKVDNFPIFIEGAIAGEKIKIKIVKVLKNFAYGKIIDIIEKSLDRVEPFCPMYKRCGGCNLRHINYAKTLEFKKDVVQNLVNKTLKNKIDKIHHKTHHIVLLENFINLCTIYYKLA